MIALSLGALRVEDRLEIQSDRSGHVARRSHRFGATRGRARTARPASITARFVVVRSSSLDYRSRRRFFCNQTSQAAPSESETFDGFAAHERVRNRVDHSGDGGGGGGARERRDDSRRWDHWRRCRLYDDNCRDELSREE